MQTGGVGGAGTGGNIYNGQGSSGMFSVGLDFNNMVSGLGASSPITGGGGGNSVYTPALGSGIAGNPGTGYGAGGSGAAAAYNGTAKFGGNGAQGVVIIDEYA
ncbi:unnamed protein product [Phaeothamnion confervicola]